MKVKCLCNLCSGQIELDSNSGGQTVACPNCGMETVLYIQPNQSTSARNINSQPDEIIYEQGNISVTRTRLAINSATYAIAAISSLRIIEISGSKLPFAFSVLGIYFFAVLPGAIFEHKSIFVTLISVLSFFFGIFLAVLAWKKMKSKKYGLRITTSAQEQQVLISPSIDRLRPVESAIQQAITLRG